MNSLAKTSQLTKPPPDDIFDGQWVVEETTDRDGHLKGYCLNVYADINDPETGGWMADLGPGTGRTDGEVIARRLNAFGPLVAALNALLDWNFHGKGDFKAVADRAVAALQKAEGRDA